MSLQHAMLLLLPHAVPLPHAMPLPHAPPPHAIAALSGSSITSMTAALVKGFRAVTLAETT